MVSKHMQHLFSVCLLGTEFLNFSLSFVTEFPSVDMKVTA